MRLIQELLFYIGNWKIGQRINEEILHHERAEYGKQIFVTLLQELTRHYGKGFDVPNLTRMTNFAQIFNNEKTVTRIKLEPFRKYQFKINKLLNI